MAIDLQQLFSERQRRLALDLRTARTHIEHSGDKGAVSEAGWVALLRGFLPARYSVDKATVIDSLGDTSESVDIVVYDRHHSPLVFEQGGFLYLPAEAVYAVFEVKQTLDAAHVAYAASKAASVRRLHRTSVSVTDIRGQTPLKQPISILAGLLTSDVGWSQDSTLKQLRKHVSRLDGGSQLDLVCAADGRSFEIVYREQETTLLASAPDNGLVFFLLTFLQRLQQMGTVAAIDFSAYKAAL